MKWVALSHTVGEPMLWYLLVAFLWMPLTSLHYHQVTRVDIRCKPGSHGDLEMKIVPLHNTKITGSKMAATKELEKERQKHKPHSRIIGQPEVIGMILGFQTVFCSKKFISVPSVSLEKRPAVITGKLTFTVDSNPTDEDRRHANRTAHAPLEPIGGAFIVSRDPPCVIGRNCFQNDAAWRQFTLAQQTQIKDNRYTNISVDAVTNYSCRPPELFFINKYVDSTLYFAYTSITKHHQTIHAQPILIRFHWSFDPIPPLIFRSRYWYLSHWSSIQLGELIYSSCYRPNNSSKNETLLNSTSQSSTLIQYLIPLSEVLVPLS